jgi:hypothetical protein
MQTIKHKRGDTFRLTANITGDSGEPITGMAAKMKSQVRNSFGELRANLVIEESSTTPGTYLFTADKSTDDWNDPALFVDIQITDDGIVKSSETIQITIEKDVTR